MELHMPHVDGGKGFDWGKVSDDYARYRDIYPLLFYEKIAARQLCVKGQHVLDLGTGTGVLPRNMAIYGASWVGIDISEEQITAAKRLTGVSMNVDYYVTAAEDIDLPDSSFDVVTACQCFWYFDQGKLIPKLTRLMKPDGRLLLLYMAWLPYEDPIASASEALVLKHNPNWRGAGETIRPIPLSEELLDRFEPVYHEEYPLKIRFTKETWHGRMRACRGVGASLSLSEIASWEAEHMNLLNAIAPEAFEVPHYAALMELKCR